MLSGQAADAKSTGREAPCFRQQRSLSIYRILAFTATGALVASRKQMDIVGFVVLGTVTGIGGGTLRDLLLAIPAFWIPEPFYLSPVRSLQCLRSSQRRYLKSRYRIILWLDAVGLAIFAVTGAEKASQAGADPIVAVAMGVITATFGGIIRDLLGGESPSF